MGQQRPHLDPSGPVMRYFFCHAPHPHVHRHGAACGQLLLAMPFDGTFSTTARRLPTEVGSDVWVRCKKCGVWNRFVLVTPRPEPT